MEQQLDWRKAGAKRGLRIEDLAQHVGTSIEGVDLDDEHDAEMVAIIRAACVENVSLGLLNGAEVDFVEDLMGASFQIKNPNAASSCGCGNSFSIG